MNTLVLYDFFIFDALFYNPDTFAFNLKFENLLLSQRIIVIYNAAYWFIKINYIFLQIKL